MREKQEIRKTTKKGVFHKLYLKISFFLSILMSNLASALFNWKKSIMKTFNNKNSIKIKRITSFAIIILVALVPFARASIIDAFEQIRYNGNFVINSTTLDVKGPIKASGESNFSLGWGNLSSVPAGFADGVDNTGGGGGGMLNNTDAQLANLNVTGTFNLTGEALFKTNIYVTGISYLGVINGTLGYGNLTGVPTFTTESYADTRITNNVTGTDSDITNNMTNVVKNGTSAYFTSVIVNASGTTITTIGNKTSYNNNISGNRSWNIGLDNSSFNIDDNGTSRLFIQNGTGNVGIGRTTPSNKLAVNGNVTINDMINSTSGNVIIKLG